MKILLSQIMNKRNISLRQLEIMTGISKSNLANIANEDISPRLDTMEVLAAALKCRITDLFDSDLK